jgi:hypothetical protein
VAVQRERRSKEGSTHSIVAITSGFESKRIELGRKRRRERASGPRLKRRPRERAADLTGVSDFAPFRGPPALHDEIEAFRCSLDSWLMLFP